jgi:hypothetical protein
LQAIGLDIHYSASQLIWDKISVAMVPSGYWSKEKDLCSGRILE